MSHPSRLAAASAIAIAVAGPAAADLSAAEVWENVRDYGDDYDLQVTVGAETPTGSGLRVEDVVFSAEMLGAEEGDGSFSATIPFMEFTEEADGSVSVTMAETTTMTAEFESEDGPISITFEISQPGLDIDVRETDDGLAYGFEGPEMVMRAVEVTEDGEPIDMSLSITFADPRGTYLSAGEAPRQLDQDFGASSASFALNVVSPEGNGTFDMSAEYTGLTSSSRSTLPGETDMANMSKAVRDGFSTDAELTVESSSYSIDFTDESGPTSISGGAGAAELTFTLGEGGLGYGLGSVNSEVVMSGGDMPIPEIRASIASSGFDFLMPILASEMPSPFGIGIRMEGLTVTDALWGMIDPAGQLDRSPWSLVLDLSGLARLDVDIMDPEATEDMQGPPGAVESVTIDEMRLSVLGADLTGTGAFAIDNTDFEAFGGMPRPEGSIDLALTGVNALFDQLIALGFVPQDQLMMGRMMLGMFARPAGEDAFESTIELRADGSIFANGQQIQ